MRKNTQIVICFLLLFAILMVLGCKKVTNNEFNIDKQSCISCGRCLQICPSDAIDFTIDGKALIDQTKCTQCGRCVRVCPKDAIY
jgi:formate hydrogenlyase subunit 6/NADH:ubiquinone oxidoreductase subunit I